MQLYLIRHPPPQVNEGICYGATDLPLRDDLAAIVRTTQTQLPSGLPFFTSPLMRCRLLAEALHPAPLLDPRLRELNFGDWEMQAWETLDRAAINAWAENPTGFTPPQGESVSELQTRVHDFLAEQYSQKTTHAALVTHAGVMKAIVGLAHGLAPAEWMMLKFGFGSVIRVQITATMMNGHLFRR
ncbi:MAG: alpha-ribazole phosphatase family protein [Pseudomonadota bacterium]